MPFTTEEIAELKAALLGDTSPGVVVPPAPTEPEVGLADVLRALILHTRFGTEAQVTSYLKAVDTYFEAPVKPEPEPEPAETSKSA